MKQYQIYIRSPDVPGWHYGDTYTNPSIAWDAMMRVRQRPGWSAKCIIATQATQGIDTEVLGNG